MSPEARKGFEDMMEKLGANKAMQSAQQGLANNTGAMVRVQTQHHFR